MPRVPTPDRDRAIRQRGLPSGPGIAGAPIEAFGGGSEVAQVFGQGAGAADDFRRFLVEEQDRGRRIEHRRQNGFLMLRANELADAIRQARGRNARGAADAAVRDYAKTVEDMMGGIGDRVVADAVQQSAEAHGLKLSNFAQGHVWEQERQAAAEEFVEGQKNRHDGAVMGAIKPDGALDRDFINSSIADQLADLEDFALDTGRGDEWLKRKGDEARSAIHRDVILSLVNSDRDMVAEAYLKDIEDQLLPQDRAAVRKLVQSSSLLGESQRMTDFIVGEQVDEKGQSKGFLSKQEALAKAREIDNPKLRAAVVRMVHARFDERDELEKESREQNFQAADDILKSLLQPGPPVPATQFTQGIELPAGPTPPAIQSMDPDQLPQRMGWQIWNGLDSRQQAAFKAVVAQANQGRVIESQAEAWTQVVGMERAALARMTAGEVFGTFRSRLSDEQYERAVRLWDGARIAEGKKQAQNQKDRENLIEFNLSERRKQNIQKFGILPRGLKKFEDKHHRLQFEFDRLAMEAETAAIVAGGFQDADRFIPVRNKVELMMAVDKIHAKVAFDMQNFPLRTFGDDPTTLDVQISEDELREAYIDINTIRNVWGEDVMRREALLLMGRARSRGTDLNESQLQDKLERLFYARYTGDLAQALRILNEEETLREGFTFTGTGLFPKAIQPVDAPDEARQGPEPFGGPLFSGTFGIGSQQLKGKRARDVFAPK